MSADASTVLANIHRRADSQSYAGSFFAQGTFGSGTVTLQVSIDGGTTKITVKDVLGNNVSLSANGYQNFVLGNPSTDLGADQITLYATLVGSTNPSLTVALFDNR